SRYALSLHDALPIYGETDHYQGAHGVSCVEVQRGKLRRGSTVSTSQTSSTASSSCGPRWSGAGRITRSAPALRAWSATRSTECSDRKSTRLNSSHVK